MKQIVHSWSLGPTSTANRYADLSQVNAGATWVADEHNVTTPWSVPGTFRNLKVFFDTAPGSGVTRTLTLRLNGVNTALSVAVSGTGQTATDAVDSVAVVAGDEVVWELTASGGTPALSGLAIYLEFDSTSTAESGYVHTAGQLDISTTPIILPIVAVFPGAYIESDLRARIAVAGDLTRYDVVNYDNGGAGEEVLGAGETATFNVVKNGIVQDGTGGTVDTTTQITDAASRDSWTGTLAFSTGDEISLRVVGNGALAGLQQIGSSSRYVADTDGQFMLSVGGVVPTSATTRYAAATSANEVGTPETDFLGIGGPNTWYITGFHLNADLGGDLTVTVDARLNLTSPIDRPIITLSDALAAGASLLTVAATTGTPSAQNIQITNSDVWAIRIIATDGEVAGSFVCGVNTTVRGSRSAAMGLDGNTNEHTESGKLKIFGNFDVTGYIEFQPMTAPAVPATGARMYLDVADGDLKVKHANGNVDVISAN